MKKGALKKVIALFLVFVLIIILKPYDKAAKAEYSVGRNFMKNNVPFDKKLSEIYMLGAHDALTYNITLNIDTSQQASEDGGDLQYLPLLVNNVKYVKAQDADAKTLLENGVRYFDIRLSYDQSSGKWRSSHSFFAGEFAEEAAKIKEFLDENKGEIVILDFQWVYDSRAQDDPSTSASEKGYGNANSYEEIRRIMLNLGLWNYVYNTQNKYPNELTYGQVTNNGTESKVIILTKATNRASTSTSSYYPQAMWRGYYKSQADNARLRSTWHNVSRLTNLISGINSEANTIASTTTYNKMFRVMQAQTNTVVDLSRLSINLVDLIGDAPQIHKGVYEHESFYSWLEKMPIYMVDYATDRTQVTSKNPDMVRTNQHVGPFCEVVIKDLAYKNRGNFSKSVNGIQVLGDNYLVPLSVDVSASRQDFAGDITFKNVEGKTVEKFNINLVSPQNTVVEPLGPLTVRLPLNKMQDPSKVLVLREEDGEYEEVVPRNKDSSYVTFDTDKLGAFVLVEVEKVREADIFFIYAP